MATKKKRTPKKKIPAKTIEIFKDKDAKTNRDAWNWHVIKRIHKKKPNVLYSASGYNTKAIAERAARAHNKTLIDQLHILPA